MALNPKIKSSNLAAITTAQMYSLLSLVLYKEQGAKPTKAR